MAAMNLSKKTVRRIRFLTSSLLHSTTSSVFLWQLGESEEIEKHFYLHFVTR